MEKVEWAGLPRLSLPITYLFSKVAFYKKPRLHFVSCHNKKNFFFFKLCAFPEERKPCTIKKGGLSNIKNFLKFHVTTEPRPNHYSPNFSFVLLRRDCKSDDIKPGIRVSKFTELVPDFIRKMIWIFFQKKVVKAKLRLCKTQTLDFHFSKLSFYSFFFFIIKILNWIILN